MASTYVNNLRLEEIGTGEQSGTWGDTTNTNLELIGQATAWGTRAIANASTDNITIADGAADADRCLGLKLTGGGQACTVTLLPNTSSKTWFMYNATAADLTFTCGSGANVVIPAGQTKVIATDGLGSGGVVHDLLTAVNLAGTTVVDDLTVSDDLTVGDDLAVTGLATIGETLAVTGIATFTDDIIIGDGKTIGSASTVAAITIASDGDITLSADLNVGANFDVTGNAVIDGTALVTGVLTTTAQAVFNGGFDGNAKATINTADGLSSDYALIVTNGETTAGQNFGMRVRGGSNASDVAFTVETYNNGSDLFRMFGNGQASFHDGTASLPSITNIGDLNTGMYFPDADKIGLVTGGTERIRLNDIGGVSVTSEATGHFVVNEGGVNADFRVESDARANMFVIDGGVSQIGVGMTPDQSWGSNSVGINFGIADADAGWIGWQEISGGDNFHMLWNVYHDNSDFRYASNNPAGKYTQNAGSHTFSHAANGSADAVISFIENLRMNSVGVVFNEGDANLDFRVESDSNPNVIFLDAGENRLGFFGSETSASTNVHNGICTKTAIGCYSVGVSDISSGATSGNIDIPFSRLGDGIHEFAYHSHGNGGTTNFGIVAHFYVQENPDRHTRVDVSSQQFTMSSSNSGSNIRITLTNGGSFTAEGGKFVIRKMV